MIEMTGSLTDWPHVSPNRDLFLLLLVRENKLTMKMKTVRSDLWLIALWAPCRSELVPSGPPQKSCERESSVCSHASFHSVHHPLLSILSILFLAFICVVNINIKPAHKPYNERRNSLRNEKGCVSPGWAFCFTLLQTVPWRCNQ